MPNLDELIEKARGHIMSPREIQEQKISFVYGQMMDCAPNITREQVAQLVYAKDGEW